jgi:hypothetical protein
MNTVSNVARDAIGSFVNTSVKTDKAKVKTLDILQSEGLVSTLILYPLRRVKIEHCMTV